MPQDGFADLCLAGTGAPVFDSKLYILLVKWS